MHFRSKQRSLCQFLDHSNRLLRKNYAKIKPLPTIWVETWNRQSEMNLPRRQKGGNTAAQISVVERSKRGGVRVATASFWELLTNWVIAPLFIPLTTVFVGSLWVLVAVGHPAGSCGRLRLTLICFGETLRSNFVTLNCELRTAQPSEKFWSKCWSVNTHLWSSLRPLGNGWTSC